MHNAWLLKRKSGSEMPQLDFRRSIVQVILQKYKTDPQGPGRPRGFRADLDSRVSNEVRLDGFHHLVEPCNRRRCVGTGCKKTVRTQCGKCDVGLCIICFKNFHIV